MRPAVLLAALLAIAAPAAAQSAGSIFLGKFDEIAAGAAGNVALRGPWIARPWRRPVPRAVVWHAISFGYERFGDASHGGKWDGNAMKDFMGREAGYFLAEGLILLVRKVL